MSKVFLGDVAKSERKLVRTAKMDIQLLASSI